MSSTIRLSSLTLPTAPFGRNNPLPPLSRPAELHIGDDSGAADKEMLANFSRGKVATLLPYTLQDRYERLREPTEHVTIVLENERLRATFMPAMGGRLWSLVDLVEDRELLYVNEAVQPANLALRNAWFAGGVEWNEGLVGHNPLTCSPLHAARVDLEDGTPALRMWEFDRIRETVYQIDAWLPSGAASLAVHIAITNTLDEPVDTYWWSNIAVPEDEQTRVIVPATTAWQFDYSRGSLTRVPQADGTVDRSRPATFDMAADFFWDVDEPDRPWIATADRNGYGLVQSSSRELRGRKLFVWGRGRGGQRWQDWLSPEGGTYLEIQAGLARTQMEHVSMPPRARWSWLESYGPLTADPEQVHHDDWACARAAVRDQLMVTAPQEWFDRQRVVGEAALDQAPAEILFAGSGWGALERVARGDASLDLPGTPFDEDQLGPEQQPWLSLLRSGRCPEWDPAIPPCSYQKNDLWRQQLEHAQDWLGLLHQGIVATHGGDHAAAERAWRASLDQQESAWAWRCLAVAAARRDDIDGAHAAYAKGRALAPQEDVLLEEHLELLLEHDRGAEALGQLDGGRVPRSASMSILEARAAVQVGDLKRAGAIIETLVVPATLREGERRLDELFYDFHLARVARERGVEIDDDLRREVQKTTQVPNAWDFRMVIPNT